MEQIDEVTLNFSPGSLMLLNGILAVVMFAIALDLKADHFRALIRAPKPVIAGFLSQFLVLPAATYLLVLALQPRPSIALGLILVAACPGGNISNFLTHRAGGNTALSVSLTAIATVGVFTMVPVWNDLWFPLILAPGDNTQTITLGVQQFIGQYVTDWNAVLAALTLAIVPILLLYLLFSRQLIRGLTSGAVK